MTDNGITDKGALSMELYKPPAAPPVRVASQEIDVFRLGETLAASGFFQDTRDAAQAVVKILAGQELGFGPIASMTGVYIVKGRVTLSANLVGAAIKRSGRYDFRVQRLGDDACEIHFFERGERIGISSFTRQDATRAGTQNMGKFPRNMLFARAMTNGARWYCPDVFGGPVYTPDELGAEVDEETGEVLRIEAADPNSRQAQNERAEGMAAHPGRHTHSQAEVEAAAAPQPSQESPATPKVSLQALQARFSGLGFGDDRDTRLALASRILDRDVASFNDLSGVDRATVMRAVNFVERLLGTPEAVYDYAQFAASGSAPLSGKQAMAESVAAYVEARTETAA